MSLQPAPSPEPALTIVADYKHRTNCRCTRNSIVTMTPAPTLKQLREERGTFDPTPYSMHIREIVDYAKDGVYAKDNISDHVIGMLFVAKWHGDILTWEGSLFQVPFRRDMEWRAATLVVGEAFWGPDGNVLKIQDRVLHGEEKEYKVSNLDWEGIKAHHNFGDWIKQTLYAGKGPTDTNYTRLYPHLNSKKACDSHVNGKRYKPGPITKLPEGFVEDTSSPTGTAKTGSSSTKKGPGAAKKGPGAAKKGASATQKVADATKEPASAAATKAPSKRTNAPEAKKGSKRRKTSPSGMQGLSRSDAAASEGEGYGLSEDDTAAHPATGGKYVSGWGAAAADTSDFLVNAGGGSEGDTGGDEIEEGDHGTVAGGGGLALGDAGGVVAEASEGGQGRGSTTEEDPDLWDRSEVGDGMGGGAAEEGRGGEATGGDKAGGKARPGGGGSTKGKKVGARDPDDTDSDYSPHPSKDRRKSSSKDKGKGAAAKGKK